jgi:hypothetical protein
MTKRVAIALAAVVIAGLGWGASPLAGQESKGVASSQAAKAVPLKVTVVIGRFQGEKRTGSLPFVMTVNAPGRMVTMQMGSQIPIPQTAEGTGYTFRNVGTNLSCQATDYGDGRYSLRLSITDNQIFTDPSGGVKGIPAFQNFTLDNDLWLRDGQTIQLGTAVDKASGEVIKVDVTLNVIK